MPALSENQLRMVVGLGNPGRRYSRTRHNIGFMVADELLKRSRAGDDRIQDLALVAPARLGELEILIVRPQTMMNASGAAVAGAMRRRGIEPFQIVVVYDDADLPFGRMRLRSGGSPAGHRGMESIVSALGTREIPRVRLGIGKDVGDLAERVLRPFTRAEAPIVETMVLEAADAVETVARDGITEAMNKYNRRDIGSAEA